MFPEDAQSYLESEEAAMATRESRTFNSTAFLYDFQEGDFIYKNGAPVLVSGQKALEIWIEKVIRTEKFKFRVYDDVEYGVTIADLVGSKLPYAFVESEIRRELSEAILMNPLIEHLRDFNFEREGSLWTVSFTVETFDEAFEMEVPA